MYCILLLFRFVSFHFISHHTFDCLIGFYSDSIAHYYHYHLGPWDLCAPHALITAMGGTITDLFGDELQIYDPQQQSYGHEKGYIATPVRAVCFSLWVVELVHRIYSMLLCIREIVIVLAL